MQKTLTYLYLLSKAACQPGTYSTDGRQPCSLCPRGTYQTHYGRVTCRSCDVIGSQAAGSSVTGATSFDQCVVSGIYLKHGFYELAPDFTIQIHVPTRQNI